MMAVLFAILLFSGVGSLYSHRLPARWALLLLVGGVLLYVPGLRLLFAATLALPLGRRVLVAVLALAPVGILMGMPFPQGAATLGGPRAELHTLGMGHQWRAGGGGLGAGGIVVAVLWR